MYVQKIITKENKTRYMLLDDEDNVIEPGLRYLKYLDSRRMALNTLKNYAYHLKIYFEYLQEIGFTYECITDENKELDILSGFITYLTKYDLKIIYTEYAERPERRNVATINAILSAVLSFYEYLYRNGEMRELNIYKNGGFSSFKGFLYEMGTKKKIIRTSILKIKDKEKPLQVIKREEIDALINHCRYIRDKLLISLLFETGLRLGEALGLRKSDFVIWDSKIKVIARENSENGVSIKNKSEGELIIPQTVVGLYCEYIDKEYIENDNDYIFVNLKGPHKGMAMKEVTIHKLFYRLSSECGIKVTPHMLRHSHATELIEVAE
ncbi:tyrosine-type recombinase/integrase [Clostridium butyricum]|uniref:tyrosine-type recombinase/integrase n=1 Tax=Clostridium butyricum TaxID=1492 RepID=UPI002ABD7B0E|nr:tyrosine-type recombinase/integrase [Clostridium butyricum]